MPLITIPKIPKLPGVPSLPGLGTFVKSSLTAAIGAVQAAIWRAFQIDQKWGIYDSKGKSLGDPGAIGGVIGSLLSTIGVGSTLSTGGVEYTKEMKISDFPLENGGFASYNKVEMPSNPSVTLTFAGSESSRKTFLDAIDKACKSTDLYSVVTPEVTYINHAIERYSYQRRSERGCTLLIVEIILKEIRQVSSQYTTKVVVADPKAPSATSTTDAGKVQAKTPDVSTLKKISDKLPSLAAKAREYIDKAIK